MDEIGICRTTLCLLFIRWESSTNRKDKFKTLSVGKDRGAKPQLDLVKDELPELVKRNNCKTNVILRLLEEQYGIRICRLILQRALRIISDV